MSNICKRETGNGEEGGGGRGKERCGYLSFFCCSFNCSSSVLILSSACCFSRLTLSTNSLFPVPSQGLNNSPVFQTGWSLAAVFLTISINISCSFCLSSLFLSTCALISGDIFCNNSSSVGTVNLNNNTPKPTIPPPQIRVCLSMAI